jgi:MFS transporter, putative metabolite:H+ symporter
LNFFTWLFVGMESCVVPTYLAELWPSTLRGKFNGWMMGFFAFGIALSPVWVYLVRPELGWRGMLACTAPFALLVGAMRFCLPESPRWLLSRGRAAEAERILERIERQVERQTGRALPAVVMNAGDNAPRRTPVGRRAILSRAWLPVTLMLWLVWFTEYGVLYTFMSVLPTLLAHDVASLTRSTGFSIVIFSGFIPGYILGGYLVDLLERKFWLMFCFAGIGVSGTLFGFTTTPTAMMTCAWFTTFFLGNASTSIYTYTPELYPTEVRASAMGFASAWGRLGGISLLMTFGIFSVLQGRLALFLVSDALLAAGIVAVALVGPRTRGRTLEAASALLEHAHDGNASDTPEPALGTVP